MASPTACLLPNEYDNLIAASRGASFSHIGASSCRLSRTMMALGEAAGVASALALRDGAAYADVMSTIYGDRSGSRPLLRRRSASGVCAVDRARSTHGGAVVGGG